jgi:hypothetical protein
MAEGGKLAAAEWRKSLRSSGTGSDCVEVAVLERGDS